MATRFGSGNNLTYVALGRSNAVVVFDPTGPLNPAPAHP